MELPAAAANPEGRRALLREQIQRAAPCGAELRGGTAWRRIQGKPWENHEKIHGENMGKWEITGKIIGKIVII